MITCRNVFNVRPKTTLLLPVWPRDTESLQLFSIGGKLSFQFPTIVSMVAAPVLWLAQCLHLYLRSLWGCLKSTWQPPTPNPGGVEIYMWVLSSASFVFYFLLLSEDLRSIEDPRSAARAGKFETEVEFLPGSNSTLNLFFLKLGLHVTKCWHCTRQACELMEGLLNE